LYSGEGLWKCSREDDLEEFLRGDRNTGDKAVVTNDTGSWFRMVFILA
jgi:hypothetical protein